MKPLEISVETAHAELAAGTLLVDIRTDAERAAGAAEGARAMSAAQLRAQCERDPGGRVNVLCAGGARSLVLAATAVPSTAAEIAWQSLPFERSPNSCDQTV